MFCFLDDVSMQVNKSEKTNNNKSSILIEKELYEEHKLNKMKQSSVSTYIDRMNQNEQTNLTYLFAKAVYASNIPFQIVDSPYLKSFFDALRPTFKLPSRKQLAGKLLDNACTETSNHISSCIKNAKCIAIVSDGWSNQRNEGIINYMLTTPQPLFYKFVACEENRHTSDYIAIELCTVIEEIGPEKVYGITTDNAANMRAAWTIVKDKYPHIQTYSCASHSMQLFAMDVEKQKKYATHLIQVKKIVQFFKNRHVAAHIFSKYREQYGITSTLSTSVATRWASSIKSIQQLQINKKALKSSVVDEEIASSIPSNQQNLFKQIVKWVLDEEVFWLKNQHFINLFSPVSNSITKMESDSCELSEVYNEFMKVKKHVEENYSSSLSLSQNEKSIVELIEHRINKVITPTHHACYLLDPRHQGENLKSEEEDNAIDLIKLIWKHLNNVDMELNSEQESSIISDIINFKARSGPFQSRSSWTAINSIKNNSITAANWWKGNFKNKSVLADVAEVLLTLPSSTACAERNWSVWGNIHSKNRNKLKTSTTGKLASVYHNLRLLKNMEIDTEDPVFISPEIEDNDSENIEIDVQIDSN